MCSVDFDGHAEFQTVSYRAARCAHRCCECSELILRGERYRIDTVKYDGAVNSYKTCLRCENLREWLIQQMKLGKADENGYVDDCDAWMFTELSNGIHEAFDTWRPPPAPPLFLDDHLKMFFVAHFSDVFEESPTYQEAT